MAGTRLSCKELTARVKELERAAAEGCQAAAKLKDLEKQYEKRADDAIKLGRSLFLLRAMVNMPELYLDQDWNIVDFSGSFVTHH